MNRKTHMIRRMLTAIALSAATALVVLPLAQARDSQVDDWFRGTGVVQPQPSRPGNLLGDYMFRDYLRNANNTAIEANDHILDVSARGTTQAGPSRQGSLVGDYMFRDFFRNANKANDHILDVSSRDVGASAPVTSESSGGIDWQKLGIGVGAALGGALLLVALGVGVIEVRHTRHNLGNA
jgi:hypothetical protein